MNFDWFVRRIAIVLPMMMLPPTAVHAIDASRGLNRYGVSVWSERNGLTFGAVNSIAQDNEGYLWLGTDNGLVRFDGTTFVPWHGSPEGSPFRAAVTTLLSGRDGSLWVGGVNGLGRIRNGVAEAFALPGGPSKQGVAQIAEEPDGTLWVAGRNVLKFQNDTWETVSGTEGLSLGGATALCIDRAGQVWISTLRGIFRRSRGAAGFEPIADYSVGSFSVDKEGGVWASDSEHGVHRLAPRPARLEHFVGQRYMRMLHDRAGTLWVGTEGLGLWRVQSAENAPSRIERLAGLEESLDDRVRRLLEDRDGNLWLATRSTLLRLSDNDVRMVGKADGLPEVGIAAVAVTADQRVWAATSQGLYSVSSRRGGPVAVRREMIGSITALHVDEHDRLWLARLNQGIRRFEVGRFSGGSVVPVTLPAGTLLSPVVSFAVDRDGGVWICENVQGVVRWHQGRVERPAATGTEGCLSAEADAEGRLWFAFRTGPVATFADGVFRLVDLPDRSVLGNPATVHAGPQAVWLNTSKGLLRVQKDGWVEATRHSALTGPFVGTIIEDGAGSIWAGISSGVVRVTTNDEDGAPPNFRVFDASSGFVGTLSGKPQGWPAAARSADGRLWFATSRGLAMIDPSETREGTSTRTARIDRVLADDREFAGSQVNVPPGTNKLEIRYGALDLSSPQSVRFRYRLDGSDTQWVDAGTRREAFYTNLPPRAYTFRLQVNNTAGGWSDSPSALMLNVQPTFAQTRWFYVLIGAMVLSMVGGAWWLRLRVVRSRFASILAERARVAREIHDTLLQNLGSVAVELEVVTNELAAAPQPAIETLRDLRKRVTECVREARDSIERLRAPGHEARSVVNALDELAQSLSASKEVACTLKVVGGDHRPGAPVVEEQLLRIAQEAVTNSVRHGRAKTIDIELEDQQDAVLLCVTDDGCGFDPNDPGCSAPGHWGIATMRERAASVGGSFNIISQVGGGTQVAAVLPLNAESGRG